MDYLSSPQEYRHGSYDLNFTRSLIPQMCHREFTRILFKSFIPEVMPQILSEIRITLLTDFFLRFPEVDQDLDLSVPQFDLPSEVVLVVLSLALPK